MDSQNSKLAWYQFSLRRLLVWVTLISCFLAAAKCYHLYFIQPIALTEKDNLRSYSGKRVTFVATYQKSSEMGNFVNFWQVTIILSRPPHRARVGDDATFTGRLDGPTTYMHDFRAKAFSVYLLELDDNED